MARSIELSPVEDAPRRRRKSTAPAKYIRPKFIPSPKIATPEELVRRPYPFRVIGDLRVEVEK